MTLDVVFRWGDFAPTGIKQVKEGFKIKFHEILPNLSRKSFDYHFWKYMKMYAEDRRNSIEEEIIRFENYLRFVYDKPEEETTN